MGAKSTGRRSISDCIEQLKSRSKPAPLSPRKTWDPEIHESIELLLPTGGKEWPCLLKSALRLWNDDLEGSHLICQEFKTNTGCYLHGLMHRREPDYGNAKYWFRRVGDHPLFVPLQQTALGLSGDLADVTEMLGETPRWDPFRMVDWCEDFRSPEKVAFLEALQAKEIEAVADYCRQKAGL